jgi:hypothetical protein
MSTTEATQLAPRRHPFTAALEARDVEALVTTLTQDAVLHSAVTGTPFRGRDMLRDVYASLFDSFDDLRVTGEFESGRTQVFFWEGYIRGRYVEGADRLRLDEAGRVAEITIVGRPMTGLAMFVSEIGFHLARRRRGAAVARVLRLTARPLAPLFALLDRIGGWVLRR